GQAGDSRGVVHLEIAEVGQEPERLRKLRGPLGRQRDVVRVAADRAVVMVGGLGVEGSLGRGEPPEATARGLGPAELRDARRWRGPERDADRAALQAEGSGELSFDASIVRHRWPLNPGSVLYCPPRRLSMRPHRTPRTILRPDSSSQRAVNMRRGPRGPPSCDQRIRDRTAVAVSYPAC